MKKKIVITIITIVALAFNGRAAADSLSARIAHRMQDSLALSDEQKNSIYTINVLLQQRKQAARNKETDITVLKAVFQEIENSRDSLYLPVLGQNKYDLYKQKKTTLLRNN